MFPVFQPFPMLAARRAQAWRYHPAYRRPRHVHDESEFNLVVAGSGVMSVGRERVELCPGSLLWLPPGLDHCLEEASADFDLVVVGFQQALLDRAPHEPGQARTFRWRLERWEGSPSSLADRLLGSADSADAAAVEERLMGALATLAPSARPSGLSERAAGLLRQDGHLGRDALARQLGINRGDLSRHFQRDHGVSIAAYKNRLRVMAFLREVERHPENLMRAALAAGFGSYSQCHRVFHQLFEVGPRDYVQGGGVDPERFEPWG